MITKRNDKSHTQGNLKNSKGITLISLVVTIIVLIILAVVSINLILGENGLIKRTQKGTHEYDKASIIETIRDDIYAKQTDKLTSGQEGKLTESELNAILGEYGQINGENLAPTGKNYEIPIVEIYNEGFAVEGNNKYSGLEIGDYVDYEKYLTTKTYQALGTDTDTGAGTGHTDNQTFTTETSTKWRVLDITSSGNIVLVSETPVNEINGIDNHGLYLDGATGYNNAETVFNNMCNTLYSTTIGTARSMTFADVAKVTGWDQVSQDSKYREYGGPYEWTKEEYEKDYSYTNKYHPEVNNGTTQTNFTIRNTYDGFWMDNLDEFQLINPSSTVCELIFGPIDDNWRWWSYWLASRAMNPTTWVAYFNVGYVWEGNAGSGSFNLFHSEYYSNGHNAKIRPVVVLESNVQIEKGADVNGVAGYNIK